MPVDSSMRLPGRDAMRAVVVHRHGLPAGLTVEEWPIPVPGAGQVLVEAHAIGVNYPDLLVIGGTYQKLPPLPFVPGKELAGVVAAVGPGVTACRAGDRVSVQLEHGAYAEAVLAPEQSCYVLPPRLGFVEAAALGLAYQTAHFALTERARFRPGETVLVTGAAGGVGLAAVQLGKAMGATVLAGIRDPAQAALVRASGADHVVDLAAGDLREALRAEVRALTGGRGADIVLDQVGGDVFEAALRALAWRGRLVVVGFAAGRIPTVRANYLLVKNIAVLGLQWSDYRDGDPASVRRVQEEIFTFWEAGRLAPRIMATYPLVDAATALERLAAGGMSGKVVLTTERWRADASQNST
jgi:NADPH2:quinone reductase